MEATALGVTIIYSRLRCHAMSIYSTCLGCSKGSALERRKEPRGRLIASVEDVAGRLDPMEDVPAEQFPNIDFVYGIDMKTERATR